MFRCDREDSFIYAWFVFVASSSSWTRSSSLRDFRQDDRYPGSHYYLCYASYYRYAALPICCSSSLPNCHEPLTFVTLPSKPLFWLCYRFCSTPLIALLVAGEDWSLFLVGTCSLLGYHNISYLINASIYLVKGGRLGLMPGVLFHSCRPSFHHTGVMFPDFASLTRLGDLWDPLDSSL